MNIAMLTNTYIPHVGGVARSVEAFAAAYRRRGHRVLIVAPEFEDRPRDETDVVRIPAIQRFNASDFSVVLPVSGLLGEALERFRPDVVHAHHPYLLGMTALRVARYHKLPLVFTHHTLYEQYTHYVPGDSPALRRFVVELAIRYANLCDQVFAPSRDVAALLRARGVTAPVAVLPTGVDLERFAHGDGAGFRAAQGIPAAAYVVGYLGRLAPEKNLAFLAEALALWLRAEPRARFLLAGKGPEEQVVRTVFTRAGVGDRLHAAGVLQGAALTDAYHAMDIFAFASKSETQGMVLTEAMAAGVPVVALDACGVRDVVRDGYNGRLVVPESAEAFRDALRWIAGLAPGGTRRLAQGARATAAEFSMEHTAEHALACYEALKAQDFVARADEYRQWQRVLQLIKAEWDILKGVARAAGAALER